MVFMANMETNKIRDRIFSVQIWEKGTPTSVNHEFIIPKDVFMNNSEKKVKELFKTELSNCVDKILKNKEKVDSLLLE